MERIDIIKERLFHHEGERLPECFTSSKATHSGIRNRSAGNATIALSGNNHFEVEYPQRTAAGATKQPLLESDYVHVFRAHRRRAKSA